MMRQVVMLGAVDLHLFNVSGDPIVDLTTLLGSGARPQGAPCEGTVRMMPYTNGTGLLGAVIFLQTDYRNR